MKKRILVVDDERDLTRLIARILTDEGFEVTEAYSASEAIRRFDETQYHLVLSDIVLGGESGIDLLRQLTTRPHKCPVVMITGVPTLETATEAVRLGAFDYITKPFSMETITRVATVALKHKELLDRFESTKSNLDAIFRTVKDMILMIDTKLNVMEANTAAMEFCELTGAEIGRPLMEVSECLYELCRDALDKTMQTREAMEMKGLEFKHAGMSKVLDLSTFPLLDDRGTLTGTVIVVRDQTRMARLEKDLNERMFFHNIVGKSPSMQRVYTLIESLSDIDSTVLISGESGTGKEMVVDALHMTGKRKDRKLIKINCAAISEQLLESELFGHVKGAFTGAISDKPGRFEVADGGTIFLDEVGDLSKATQVKLLRVLQSMEFERVGSNKPIKVDVRVVAATNRNLIDMVRSGEFREDLFYRLNVIEIHLPPLRDRQEDIPLLADYFLRKYSAKMGRPIPQISAPAMQRLMDYQWPGNIRELEHTVEYILALYGNEAIGIDNLPPMLRPDQDSPAPAKQAIRNQAESIDERDTIIKALESCGWKKAKAARMLGISRQTLYEKLRKLNIQSQ